MLPSRRGTRPMIDFIVVVLPAPLRPSKVTTSPSRTSKSTPCKMWLSPYQELSCLISSIAASGIGCPQIRGDDLGIARDRAVVTLSQHAAARQDGDRVAQPLHDGEVVFHHQDRPSLPNPADELHHA